jgi:predicted metalloprotease with PDZ domain
MVKPLVVGCRWSVVSRQFCLSLIALLAFPAAGFAATLFCQISSISPAERSFKVSCTLSDFPAADKIELRFVDHFAGIERLSERLFGLQIKDASGQRLLPELLGNGVYRISPGTSSSLAVEYEMRLAQVNGAARDPSKYALTSNLSSQCGFLLLSDVLPGICPANQDACAPAAVRLKLQLPDEWQVATTEPESFGAFDVAAVERAVFFIGRLRTQTLQIEQMKIQLALAGDVALSDLQIAVLVEALARQQAAMISSQEQGHFLVTLTPFPVPLTGLRSAALTRGRSVVMLLNPGSDPKQNLALYQKHLAHELFHFYLPEAFRARENFDWFWEGFTRYAAALTLNRLRLMSLREYLDELGLEYEAYAINPLRKQVSLLAASQGKFANAASYELVYRKGTLVAALYDLELRRQSAGRHNVMDVLRELYANYRQRELGNGEVLATLRQAGKFEKFIMDYIAGTRDLALAEMLKPYGLKIETAGGAPRVIVAGNLSLKQNALLAQLGH